MKTRIHSASICSRLGALLYLVLASSGVWADPIWHCSRGDMKVADASEQFTLAALEEREVIRLTMPDLYSVYLGQPIKVSGLPLSACLISDNNKPNISALQTLGASETAAKVLARKSNITKSNLHIVRDEAAMLACIAQNHPAIGYLPKATHTEAVGPCF